jgi:hypothetical protein
MQSTTLDEFLCFKDTMPGLNDFMDGAGPPRVLVYCRKVVEGREGSTPGSLVALPPVQQQVVVRISEGGQLPPNVIKLAYFVNKVGGSIPTPVFDCI